MDGGLLRPDDAARLHAGAKVGKRMDRGSGGMLGHTPTSADRPALPVRQILPMQFVVTPSSSIPAGGEIGEGAVLFPTRFDDLAAKVVFTAPDSAACWIQNLSGAAMDAGQKYPCGPAVWFHEGRPVFVVGGDGGGTGLTTSNTDATEESTTERLEFSQPTGVKVTKGATDGDPDVVSGIAASLTQMGMVTTGSQAFAGAKAVRDGLAVGEYAAGAVVTGDLSDIVYPALVVWMDTTVVGSSRTGHFEVVDSGGSSATTSSANVKGSISTSDVTHAGAEAHLKLNAVSRWDVAAQIPLAIAHLDVLSGNIEACGSAVLSLWVLGNVQTGEADTDLFGGFGVDLFARPTVTGSDSDNVVEVGVGATLDYVPVTLRRVGLGFYTPIWASASGLVRRPWESEYADIIVGQCRRFGVKRGTPAGSLPVMGIDIDMPEGARPIVRGGLVVGYIDSDGDYHYPDAGGWAGGACLAVTVPPASPPVPPPPSPPVPPPPPPPGESSLSGVASTGWPGYDVIVGRTVTLSGANSATTTTSAFGRYSFGSLTPGGTTLVTFDADPTELVAYDADGTGYTSGDTAPVTLVADTLHVVTFRADVGTDGVIAGTVADGVDSPLSGRTVTLSGTNTATTTTDGSGGYSFSGLTYGSTTATCSPGGGHSMAYNLDAAGYVGTSGVATFDVLGTHDLDYRETLTSPPVPPPPPGP